jgi:Toprim domain
LRTVPRCPKFFRNRAEIAVANITAIIASALPGHRGIKSLPMLVGIESLWIAVNHDEAGIAAARSTARRREDSGAEAFMITPSTARADLNDLFATGAYDA